MLRCLKVGMFEGSITGLLLRINNEVNAKEEPINVVPLINKVFYFIVLCLHSRIRAMIRQILESIMV